NITVPEAEMTALETYLVNNGLMGTAVEDTKGFYYTIQAAGTGTPVSTLCDLMTVKYKGSLSDGTVFDQTTTQPAEFQLGQLIQVWRLGLQLIKSGGKITLYLPPTMGYGNQDVKDQNGVVKIPANSITIFEIELIDVK